MVLKFDKNTGEVDNSLDFEIVIKKQVTIPVMSIDGGGTFYIIPIEHPVAKIMLNKKGNPKKNEDGSIASMKIIKIINYKEKTANSMVLPATVYGNLKSSYPAGFLGYLFRIIIPKDKAVGKSYKQCTVDEIHLPKEANDILAKLTPPVVLSEIHKLNTLTSEFWRILEPVKTDEEGDD